MPAKVTAPLELTTLALDLIQPYWRNPRNNEDAVAEVAESIKRYGYNQPILVDLKQVIIAGDTRYRALRSLGRTHAQVIVRDLPPKQARALRIIDNKVHELAGWDLEALKAEIAEAGDLTAWFTPGELAAFTRAPGEAPAPINPADMGPAPPRTGQVPLTCPYCNEHFGADAE